MTPLERLTVDIMVSPSKLGVLVYLSENKSGLSLEALQDRIAYHPHTLHDHIEEMITLGIVERTGLSYRLTELGKQVDDVARVIASQSKI